MIVREEQASDRTGVEALVEAAFRDLAVSDHTEHLLVARLRSAPTFIPELSLVAEECNRIVGHVLLTPVAAQRRWALRHSPWLPIAGVGESARG